MSVTSLAPVALRFFPYQIFLTRLKAMIPAFLKVVFSHVVNTFLMFQYICTGVDDFWTNSLIYLLPVLRNSSNWSGKTVMSILVSVLMSFNSIGYFMIAIFASSTSLGMFLETNCLINDDTFC